MKVKHQPIIAAGRTMRIVQRKQVKKSMKNRIKNLRVAARVAFQAGKESVLLAAHSLDYGEGYVVGNQSVLAGGTDSVGVGIVNDADLTAPVPAA